MGNLIPFLRVPFIVVANASSSKCLELARYRDDIQIALFATSAAAILLLNLVKIFSLKKLSWRVLEYFPILPLDLQQSHYHRLTHCLILTLWATDSIQDALNRDMIYHYHGNGLLNAAAVFILSPIVVFLRQALFYFPVLACVHSSLPTLTYFTGLSCVSLMGGYNIFRDALVLQGCSHRGHLSPTNCAISLVVKVPVYVGYVWLMLWYFCCAFRSLVKFLLRIKTKEPDPFSGFRDHVRWLLRSRYKLKKRSPLKRWSLFSYIYHGLHYVLPLEFGFHYPLSFLASICMAWGILYQLCIQAVTREVELADDFINWVKSFNITVEVLKNILPSHAHFFDNVYYDANSLTTAMLIIVPFGTCIGLGLCAFVTVYLVQNVHKHLVRASRGDLGFLVASEPLPSKAYILAATSFQLAYLVLCWVFYSFMMSSLLSLGLIFYYLFKNYSFQGFYLWSLFMVPMMWGLVLHYLQIFLCRHVFLAPESRGSDLIGIRFKGLYYFLTYFLVFFNVLFALVTCLLRVLGCLIFTMIMFFRLDWDVYMRGLEGWDFGHHRTYMGYIYLEYTHSNAVLRVFVELLQKSLRQDRIRYSSPPRNGHSKYIDTVNEKSSLLNRRHPSKRYSEDKWEESSTSISRSPSNRARNRWWLAYTLIHNPQLRQFTA